MGYDAFRTDAELEHKGVWMDYDEGFRVKLARAGGANSRYRKLGEKLLKPIRRALDVGAVSDKRGQEIALELFSQAVILDWEIRGEDGEYRRGIEDPETGEILEPTPANIKRVLSHPELADLFTAIQQDASKNSIFLREIRGLEAKN